MGTAVSIWGSAASGLGASAGEVLRLTGARVVFFVASRLRVERLVCAMDAEPSTSVRRSARGKSRHKSRLTSARSAPITVRTRMAGATRPDRRPVMDLTGDVTRREVLKGTAAIGIGAIMGRAQPARAQGSAKKELATAQGGSVARFDPHFSTSSNDILVSFNLFDKLTSRHPDGKLHPGLATEWKLEAPTTWRFKLRQGVKFHNGDPFTSADAKFSIERTYDPAVKTMVSTALATIERIEASDPYTLVIHTKKPDPLLPARLAFYGGQIVPKKYIEAVGNDTFNAKPVGTGPVSFSSWVKDDRAVFDANGSYWGGKIDADRWIMRAIPETAPRIAALLKGETDVIVQVPPDQNERINSNPSTRVAGVLYAGLYVLGVNSKRPPLDNPLVKQALSLAIDRELIVKELWKGRGIVPSQPIAKGDNHFDPTLPPLAYNPKEARERLKKAGYKGEEIIIETTVAYVAQDKAMSE